MGLLTDGEDALREENAKFRAQLADRDGYIKGCEGMIPGGGLLASKIQRLVETAASVNNERKVISRQAQKIQRLKGHARNLEKLNIRRIAKIRELEELLASELGGSVSSGFVRAAIKVKASQTAGDKIAMLAALCEELGIHCFAYGFDETDALAAEVERLKQLINHPFNDEWFEGVEIEAAHQHERWGSQHDDGKEPEDWVFLAGHLTGKGAVAQRVGDLAKAKHHTISVGAVMLNWFRRLCGQTDGMRPGIKNPFKEQTDGTDTQEASPHSPAAG